MRGRSMSGLLLNPVGPHGVLLFEPGAQVSSELQASKRPKPKMPSFLDPHPFSPFNRRKILHPPMHAAPSDITCKCLPTPSHLAFAARVDHAAAHAVAAVPQSLVDLAQACSRET